MFSFPDVNECEMLSGVCGEALCDNVEGSFLCLCSDDNQEYDPMTGQCRFRTSPGNIPVALFEILQVTLIVHATGKTLIK